MTPANPLAATTVLTKEPGRSPVRTAEFSSGRAGGRGTWPMDETPGRSRAPTTGRFLSQSQDFVMHPRRPIPYKTQPRRAIVPVGQRGRGLYVCPFVPPGGASPLVHCALGHRLKPARRVLRPAPLSLLQDVRLLPGQTPARPSL